MKIGAQMYTIREFTKTPRDIETSLKKLKSIGFDMVQISGVGDNDVEWFAGVLKEIGIEVCGTHSPWEKISNPAELDILIENHKKLSAYQIGIGGKPADYPNTYEGYKDFIKKANEICKQIKAAGLGFGYHNHDFEFEKYKGKCAIDMLIEECPDMEFTFDVFWAQAGGVNPCDYIDKLKARIRIFHLKDYRIVNRQRQYAEIGEGNINWDTVFSCCAKNNVHCAVIEQDGDFLTGPFESLALSRKFLIDKGFWKS